MNFRSVRFGKVVRTVVASVCLLALMVGTGCGDGESPDVVENDGGGTACGDDVAEDDEVCDGEDLGEETCESLGYEAGELACRSNCSDYDLSGCGSPDSCGNGEIDEEEDEACDGEHLEGRNCADFGLGAGDLGCADNCLDYDLSGCGPLDSCGNGEVDEEDGEVCDGANLDGNSCEDFGLGAGELSCAENCTQFDLSGCGGSESCGNGEIDEDDGEVCDGDDLGGTTCGELGYDSGALACADNCAEFDTTGCEEDVCEPDCSDVQCGPDPVCGEPCGTCGDYEGCESGQCVAFCELETLSEDTTVDLNADTVDVTVTVDIDGETMPDNDLDSQDRRGAIEFLDRQTFDSTYYNIPPTGEATIDAELFPGTYDIILRPDDADEQDAIPHVEYQLSEEVDLTESSDLNYDLETTTVTGEITIDGATMPDNTQSTNHRADLWFRDGATDDVRSVRLGEEGEASYEVELFATEYDVTLNPEYSSNQNAIPGVDLMLERDVDVGGDPTLDYDVETTTVTGEITIDGATMPDNTLSSNHRADLWFRDDATGDVRTVRLGEEGEASYEVELFATEYEVELNPEPSSYQDAIPGVDVILDTGVDAGTQTTLDYDVETTTVTGKITVDGATMPDNTLSSDERAWLRFRDSSNGDSRSVGLGEEGEAAFEVELFATEYDVQLRPNYGDDQDAIPLIDTVLDTGVDAGGDPTLDYDVETTTVTGEVTVDGEAMPDSTMDSYPYNRADLRFRDITTGDSLGVELGNTGAATYEVELFAAEYNLEFEPEHGDDQDAIPTVDVVLDTAVDTGGDPTLGYDLATITVTGEVSLDGGTMPDNSVDASDSRGSVYFQNAQTGSRAYGDLGAQGEANYSVDIFAGTYDVYISPAGSDQQDVLPYGRHLLERGCPPLGSCEGSADDVTGRWLFVQTASFGVWGDYLFELEQDGDTVEGSFQSTTGYSDNLTDGTLEGDTLTAEFTAGVCSVNFEATILNGCAAIGVFDTPGCFDATFAGQRVD